MNTSDRSTRTNNSSALGDAIRALSILNPKDKNKAREILRVLGLSTKKSTVESYVDNFAFSSRKFENSREQDIQAPKKNIKKPNDSLPETVESNLTKIIEENQSPPGWLDEVPLIPLPTTISNPFKKPIEPLFKPDWQRVILSRAASAKMNEGEFNIEDSIDIISKGKLINHVPKKEIATVSQGLQLLVDSSSSLLPYKLDINSLSRELSRLIGPHRLSLILFNGVPSWGGSNGLDNIEYHPPPTGTPVIILSDLCIGAFAANTVAPSFLDWEVFFSKLRRNNNSITIIVPREADEIPRWFKQKAFIIPWGRSTSVNHLRLHNVRTYNRKTKAFNDQIEIDNPKLPGLQNLTPDALELAKLCSLAIRIEPQLMRGIRIKLLPHCSVGVEAELWFSDLVEQRGTTGITFYQHYRTALQESLSPDFVRACYEITQKHHAESPLLVKIEEELCFCNLIGDTERTTALLRSLVATLIEPQRTNLSLWTEQALVRLPGKLMETDEGKMLAVGTTLRTGGSESVKNLDFLSSSGMKWLQPKIRQQQISVTLRKGMIEFGPRISSHSNYMKIPDSKSVVIEIIDIATEASRQVTVFPSKRTSVEVDGEEFELRIIGGDRWKLGKPSKSSSEKFIARNRAPRVQIEYEVELYGSEKRIQLPFINGIMTDLSGPINKKPDVADRKFLGFDIDNFNNRMKTLQPRLVFRVKDLLTNNSGLEVDLTFQEIDDFTPSAITDMVAPLKLYLEQRQALSILLTHLDGTREREDFIQKVLSDKELIHSLSELYTQPGNITEPFTQSSSENQINILDLKLEGRVFYDWFLKELKVEKDSKLFSIWQEAMITLAYFSNDKPNFNNFDSILAIQHVISGMDRSLSEQVNQIIHHNDFQQLESSWRGLHYLVNNTETDEMLKIRVLDITKDELSKTLQEYTNNDDDYYDWDQSPIFKKIYEEEYGQFGGEPYGCLVGDYYFDHSPDNIALLKQLSQIASAAHTPFITAPSPKLLNIGSWQELDNSIDLTKIFETAEYLEWHSFRESDDARCIGMAMPRFLGRLPYGAKTNPVEEFSFEEEVENSNHNHYCWVNAAYAMARNINQAFRLYGWCSRIRGLESGGAVEGLPTHTFPTDDGDVDMKCPTEIAISDRREVELAKNGFMPLLHKKNSDFTVFIGAQSLQKTPEFDDPDATANANLAARLPYLFASYRFIHYLKAVVRDKVGSFKDREDMERFLNNWIMQYVEPNPESSESMRVRRPLGDAKIEILEIDNNFGYYDAHIYLRPHYQLEGLTEPMQFTTRFPSVR